MSITNIQLFQVTIPLRFRFAQSNNPSSTASNSSLLVLESTDGQKGYGEACPRMYVTGEDQQRVLEDSQKGAAILKEADYSTLDQIREVIALLSREGIGPSLRCAAELALLDLHAKTKQQSLDHLFAIAHPKKLAYSMVLPLMKPEQLEGLLKKIPPFVPPAIKIKVTNDLENALGRIQVIRNHFGAHTPIRLDVNGGWMLAEAQAQVPEYLQHDIRSFEQPLPAGQFDEMAELTKTFGQEARIMADESLLGMASARELIDKNACNHFNLKISKLGGLLTALDVYQLAHANGIPCQLGAHFGETSLLGTAGIILANKAPQLTNLEGAMSGLLLENDIFAPAVQHDLKGQLNSEEYLKLHGWSSSLEAGAFDQYAHSLL